MRAIWMREFGGPEVLVAGEAPDPVAGEGQVVIDVAHANITFVETQFRATGFGPFTPELPMIPGNGVGGTVDGRRVVATTGGSGGYAERVAVDEEGLIPVPDGVRLDDATALLADGRTALWLLDALAVEAGERVLVLAAAGGVGTLLVQLLRDSGATVLGAAGGPRKVDVVRSLGASLTFDYTDPAWADEVGSVDVVLDGVGGPLGRAAFERISDGGRLLAYGASSGDRTVISDKEAAARGVSLIAFQRPTPAEQRAYTASALGEAAAGRLLPLIGQRFPLERAADAHRAIETRATIGKTLLDISP